MANDSGAALAGRSKTALILTGGGARAAYQAGVLRALSEWRPKGAPTPFPIICGTSAGSINATVLAVDAENFRIAVRRLVTVWKNFHADHVYRADVFGALRNSARWIFAGLTGGRPHRSKPVSLLDNAPLAALLDRHVNFARIQEQIDGGYLAALSITCSGYSSGHSVTFYQGQPDLKSWHRARRVGVAMPIELNHLLASSALPFIFPPMHINREYFGDGSMRQIAPLSPALHLGAERLLVIGVGRQLQAGNERLRGTAFPTLAQIAGHALNSIFLDSLEVDLERMQRINRTIALIPEAVRRETNYPLRRVAFRVLTPSEELERIAARYAHELPKTIRTLLSTVGGTRRSGSTLLSYLLFEKSFCRELIKLGYKDTMARKDDLMAFLEWPELVA
ncbi:MAG: patatin-like phospholipase family protein [Betaproteobacteria bacterium]|nr:patatin-like phospholipase family protein [Betaproteobacteria bacterium]